MRKKTILIYALTVAVLLSLLTVPVMAQHPTSFTAQGKAFVKLGRRRWVRGAATLTVDYAASHPDGPIPIVILTVGGKTFTWLITSGDLDCRGDWGYLKAKPCDAHPDLFDTPKCSIFVAVNHKTGYVYAIGFGVYFKGKI